MFLLCHILKTWYSQTSKFLSVYVVFNMYFSDYRLNTVCYVHWPIDICYCSNLFFYSVVCHFLTCSCFNFKKLLKLKYNTHTQSAQNINTDWGLSQNKYLCNFWLRRSKNWTLAEYHKSTSYRSQILHPSLRWGLPLCWLLTLEFSFACFEPQYKWNSVL